MPIEPPPPADTLTIHGTTIDTARPISFSPSNRKGDIYIEYVPATESSLGHVENFILTHRGRTASARRVFHTIDGYLIRIEFESNELADAMQRPAPGTMSRVRIRGTRPAPSRDPFRALTADGRWLFRGDHGTHSRAVVSEVGVGPARKVADALCRLQGSASVTEELKSAVGVLVQHCDRRRTRPSGLNHDPLAMLCHLISEPEIAINVFSPLEHVAPQNRVNDIHTVNLLVSTTFSPQIAILYAYGIYPDKWEDTGGSPFARGGPAADAFVALMDGAGLAPTELAVTTSIAGLGVDIDEINRRLKRDLERTESRLLPVRAIIDLPAFDPSDYWSSLIRAAERVSDVLRRM